MITETGSDFEESRLKFNAFGKPSLSDLDIHFNLAHSGEWVVCAVDEDEIGVDIEAHHSMDFGVANRFFCREERALLEGKRAEAEYARTFFRIWSLKESYVKAIGKGFSCPLDSFACLPTASVDGAEIEFHPHGDETTLGPRGRTIGVAKRDAQTGQIAEYVAAGTIEVSPSLLSRQARHR